MNATIQCPNCNKLHRVSTKQAGVTFSCDKCHQPLTVPGSRPPAIPKPPAVPTASPPGPRRGSQTVFLLGAFVLLVAAGAVAWWQLNPTRPLPPDIHEPPPSSAPAKDPPVAVKAADDPVRTVRWRFDHDDAGRPTRTVDPSGTATTFRYDLDADKKVQRMLKEVQGRSVTMEFDRFGRRTVLHDSAGTLRSEYDDFSRPRAFRRAGAHSYALTHEYDPEGRLSAVSLGEGPTVRYGHDFLGRLVWMDTPAGRVSYDHRPGHGQVVRTLPGGLRTLTQQGPDGQLAFIEHSDAKGKVLARFDYAYRADGLIRQVREQSPEGEKKIDYEYDSVQRLVVVTDLRRHKTTYAYDGAGNRTEVREPGKPAVHSSYDWAGRLVRHADQPCIHDAAGHLTEYTGGAGKTTCTYTPEGQLATVATARGQATYTYDGDGRLISRSVGGRQTTFVPDPTADIWRPLLATDAEGKRTVYIWEGDRPVAAVSGTEVRLFLHDHLGSVRCVADGQGRVVARQGYGPFGQMEEGVSASALAPGFAGLFLDAEAGLYLTRARGYDPVLGRFLQPDPQHRMPMGSQKDLSAYGYCGGDPLNYTDRDGAEPQYGGSTSIADEAMRWLKTPYKHAQEYAKDPTSKIGVGVDCSHLVYEAIKGSVNPQFSYRQANFYNNPTMRNNSLLSVVTTPQKNDLISWKSHVGVVIDPAKKLFVSATDHGVRVYPWTMKDWSTGKFSNPIFLHVSGKASDTVPRQATRSQGPGGPGGNIPSQLSPTKVGGVALAGAGNGLKSLGSLEGIALDANGRLVLLSRDKGGIDLPPLRLDDVVTIFTRIYEHGVAPFVSIDPDPKKPEGDTMHVRLGPDIGNTYVGWVLFEADRVMKCYSLGHDNLTGKPFTSDVAGYKSLFDLGPGGGTAKGRLWERFWITPANATRRQDSTGKLTLLEVPLRLETQAMVRGTDGLFLPAPGGKSSPAATAFTRWFTDHYDDIAREARSQPPPDSGMTEPVAIFAELRRMALIVGLAECLREQGVPIPGWMREYKVKPFPVPTTTPGRTFTVAGKGSIYGGVTLSIPKGMLRSVPAPSAEALAPVLGKAIAAAPLLTSVPVEQGRTRYQAIALPGEDTLALGACQLEETDLSVSPAGGPEVQFVRHHHSFFLPNEGLGTGWTLDLPRLDERRRVVPRGDKKVLMSSFRLTSPLGSHGETFARQERVAEVDADLLVPEGSRVFLGLGLVEDKELGRARLLLFRDGRRWYFNESGDLLARKDAVETVLYRRDKQRRLTRIEGRRGDRVAAIDLEYDAAGRLAQAQGSDGSSARYSYEDGRLVRVTGPAGSPRYRYQDGLVTAVLRDGKPMRTFVHGDGGRLRSERQGDGDEVTYAATSGPAGVRMTASRGGKVEETVEYDLAHRPRKRTTGDGTVVEWNYAVDGASTARVTQADGERYTATRSADGKEERWRLPEGGEYGTRFDDTGRVVEQLLGGRSVLRQDWHPNGLFRSMTTPSATLTAVYGPGGVPAGFRMAPSGAKSAGRLEAEVDGLGRLTRLADQFGSMLAVAYDEQGRPKEVTSAGNKVSVERDSKGLLKAVRSAGLAEVYAYHAAGGLRQVRSTRDVDGRRATATTDHDEGGRPVRARHFDGGETVIDYLVGAGDDWRPRTIRTPGGLPLTYEYDSAGRVRTVTCGTVCRFEYTHDAKGRLVELAQVPLR